MKSKKRLGRGLEVLLGDRGAHASARNYSGSEYVELPVGALTPGQFQPRQTVDDESLSELVESIQQQGVLQPLLVRAISGSKTGSNMVEHEIVAGERRWRAARLAGLKTVPVLIRDLDDEAALAAALIENLQREDLNPIEVAESLLKLTRDFGLTHEQAAKAVGRSRSAVSNYLRLLDLDGNARDFLLRGKLDMGHARALLPLDEREQQLVANKIADEDLSVRQVEHLVQKLQATPDVTETRPKIDLQTRWLQKQFASELGMKVAIRLRKDGGRTLGIDFDDLDQLQGALYEIGKLVAQVRETAGPRASRTSQQ
jgi:ParB family chromosome partitioning protein